MESPHLVLGEGEAVERLCSRGGVVEVTECHESETLALSGWKVPLYMHVHDSAKRGEETVEVELIGSGPDAVDVEGVALHVALGDELGRGVDDGGAAEGGGEPERVPAGRRRVHHMDWRAGEAGGRERLLLCTDVGGVGAALVAGLLDDEGISESNFVNRVWCNAVERHGGVGLSRSREKNETAALGQSGRLIDENFALYYLAELREEFGEMALLGRGRQPRHEKVGVPNLVRSGVAATASGNLQSLVLQLRSVQLPNSLICIIRVDVADKAVTVGIPRSPITHYSGRLQKADFGEEVEEFFIGECVWEVVDNEVHVSGLRLPVQDLTSVAVCTRLPSVGLPSVRLPSVGLPSVWLPFMTLVFRRSLPLHRPMVSSYITII